MIKRPSTDVFGGKIIWCNQCRNPRLFYATKLVPCEWLGLCPWFWLLQWWELYNFYDHIGIYPLWILSCLPTLATLAALDLMSLHDAFFLCCFLNTARLYMKATWCDITSKMTWDLGKTEPKKWSKSESVTSQYYCRLPWKKNRPNGKAAARSWLGSTQWSVLCRSVVTEASLVGKVDVSSACTSMTKTLLKRASQSSMVGFRVANILLS